MPLTLAEFLAVEPTLVRLRKEVETCDRHDRRRLGDEEHALVAMLVNRWEAGLSGWMTFEEAHVVAASLQAEALALGVDAATAAVEQLQDGSVLRPFLVFRGGRRGHHVLTLAATSPIRARMHWCGYLEACLPPPAPAAPPPPEPAPAPAQQLGLLETLANLVRPGRRRTSENRSRILGIPYPKARR